ncbi:hypothetical protein BCR39DRAFT_518237 [Naematelia encephala]|uniref:Adipose-regulatory protein-domain-containing protein n=1 Tax=Naematelia encephala TaxID=71784 RepID=A0A1Y2BIX7_9TREE|nr:hypothetical protein BCR39DRAFT_518237 [Naematelia encephala]
MARPSTASASLDPYLRERAANPSLIPSKSTRTARIATTNATKNEDFLDFLRGLGRLVLSPVTFPAHLIHQTLTSPLTISLVLKLLLLGALTLASAVFSVLAVGAFWYSWGTGGLIEVEGWLVYGAKSHRSPHTLIPLPVERFQEDLRYDVQIEMELVRPSRGSEEMGNFMLTLDLRSNRDPEISVLRASQPSLPPPPLPSTLLSLPSIPTSLIPPCVIPWPFRSLCPSRLLGYDGRPNSKIRERRKRGGFASPAHGKDVVLLRKELMEAVLLNPGRGGDAQIGSAFVSIGREDSFGENDGAQCDVKTREVRTTGWVVVRFVPRPTGIRWLLVSHPFPPLLLLPPISLGLTLSSSFFAFIIISYLRSASKKKSKRTAQPILEEKVLEDKRKAVFAERDREERREADRRKAEWEEVESSALGGMRRVPEERKRSRIGESTIGGSETTVPTNIQSFATIPESGDETESTATGTATETRPGDHSRRHSRDMDGWD